MATVEKAAHDKLIVREEMMNAAKSGDLQKVEELTATYGLSYCEEWLDGCALLNMALAFDKLEIVEALVKAGAKLSNNEKKINILHKVITKPLRYIPIVKLLFTKGASVNAKDELGHSPLHIVQSVGMARFLFSSHAVTCPDVNAQDNEGQTPLHLVVSGRTSLPRNSMLLLVKCLLDNGADVNILNKKGLTPLEVFDRKSYWRPRWAEVSLALRSHVAKLKCADLPVSEDNLMASKRMAYHIRETLDDPVFVKRCKYEVEKMKKERIGASCVSFYDVLSRRSRQLASYSKNALVSCVMDSKESVEDKFPIYGRWVDVRYRRAKRRVQLLEKAVSSLTAMCKFLPLICAELIADYLSNQDLQNCYECYPLDD